MMEQEVADKTPKYLGSVFKVPVTANEGDWFTWAGESTGSISWKKLDENDTANHAEFMAALSDILLLHNAEPGYFSTIFANALIAHEVFAEYVKTSQLEAEKVRTDQLEITVDDLDNDITTAQTTANNASTAASNAQNDINGIKNTDAAAVNAAKTPAIKSSNWLQDNFTPSDIAGGIGEDKNTAGFCIMKNGDAYFNNASLRGRLKMSIYNNSDNPIPSDLKDGEIFLYSIS